MADPVITAEALKAEEASILGGYQAFDQMAARIAALEEKQMASERWLGGPEERLLHLRGQHDALQVQVNTLEDRMNGLVTVIAALKASPPGGKPAPTAKKKPARRR